MNPVPGGKHSLSPPFDCGFTKEECARVAESSSPGLSLSDAVSGGEEESLSTECSGRMER